jgi:hypothetical protein
VARNNPDLPALVDSAINVVAQIIVASQTCEFSLQYIASSTLTPTAAHLTAFGVAWLANVGTALLACMTPDAVLRNILIQDLNPGTCPSQSVAAGGPGTVTGHCYPTPVAAILTKQTPVKGQRGRGRLYVPAVPLSFVTPGTEIDLLNAGAITLYQALATALLLPVAVTGYGSWVVSIVSRPVPPALIPSQGDGLTGMQPVTLLGTQRRRREGRGI